jgi:PTS system nitrogen regulatory IIA component
VLLDLAAADLDEALDVVGRLLQTARGPKASTISERLRRREARESTVLGHGVVLPHAQVPGLRAPVTAYLRLRRQVAGGAAGLHPVQHLVALVVPKPAAVPHFQLLSRLEGSLRQPALRRALADCRTPEDACRVFEAPQLLDT